MYPSLPGVFVVVFTLLLVAAFLKKRSYIEALDFYYPGILEKISGTSPEPVGDLTQLIFV